MYYVSSIHEDTYAEKAQIRARTHNLFSLTYRRYSMRLNVTIKFKGMYNCPNFLVGYLFHAVSKVC